MTGNIWNRFVKHFVFFSICFLLPSILLGNCAKTEKEIAQTNIFDEIRTLMSEKYFYQSQLPDFNARLEAIENNPNTNLSEELNRLLASLQVSHIGFYTHDDLEYYAMLEVFRFLNEDKIKTMFPPDGIVWYNGIGIAPRLVNGRHYVAFVYADTPPEQAGILPGDELLTVDGQPYTPVRAFQGKVGQTVKLAIRRVQNGPVLEFEVAVVSLNPTETLVASTKNSGRVIEQDGYKFGYIRMYSYAGETFGQILIDTISGENFTSADALILDIRGQWGGAPLDAAEVFVGGTPTVEFITSANEITTLNFRWTKPLIVIIGSETRSGLEIMAYSLKKAGFPVIGTTTAGAVVGGSAFVLSDGSLLMIPVIDIRVDGQRIEGVGVSPTVPVNTILEYSQGNDPQLEMAINKAVETMEGGQ